MRFFKNLFTSFKRNFGLYLIHLTFISLIAPLIVGSVLTVEDLIQFDYYDTKDMVLAALIMPIFCVVLSVHITLPLSALSAMMFRNIVNTKKNNRFVFSMMGLLFGLFARFLLVDLMHFDEGGIFFDASFLISGGLVGLALHWFWKHLFIPNSSTSKEGRAEIDLESEFGLCTPSSIENQSIKSGLFS